MLHLLQPSACAAVLSLLMAKRFGVCQEDAEMETKNQDRQPANPSRDM